MGEFERRGDGTLCWIGRVLIKLELFNRDPELRRLRFVDKSLHQQVAWKEFLVEYDSEFLVCRPVFCRRENKDVAREPAPRTVELRLKLHRLGRPLSYILPAGALCA